MKRLLKGSYRRQISVSEPLVLGRKLIKYTFRTSKLAKKQKDHTKSRT